MKKVHHLRKHKELSLKERNDISAFFFGPFKPEWFDEDGVLNNRDKTIAKILGLPLYSVEKFTTRLIKEHFENLNVTENRKVI